MTGCRAASRPNLVAYLPGKRPEKVWVLSHMDVVPPGDLSLWDSDPFTLRVDGDRLYGRGTEDDHHGIVMSLMAVRAFLDLELTPERTLALALVADEETGNDKGLAYLLREHPGLFSPQDLIIVPDAGSKDGTMIEVAEKSILWLKLTLLGQQGHASRPHKAKNTLRAAAHVIVALDELQREFPRQNPLFRPPMSTFEPTRKEANVPNINTIPGRDVFYLDCRVLPDYDLAQVTERVRAIATEAAEKFGVTLEVEPVQTLASAPPTAPEAPVVKALAAGHSAGLWPGSHPPGDRRRHRGRLLSEGGPARGGLDDRQRLRPPAQRILFPEPSLGGRQGAGPREFDGGVSLTRHHGRRFWSATVGSREGVTLALGPHVEVVPTGAFQAVIPMVGIGDHIVVRVLRQHFRPFFQGVLGVQGPQPGTHGKRFGKADMAQ